MPRQRERPAAAPDNDRATVVLPYVGTRTASRTRSLRVWMMSLPVDFVAFLVPLAYNRDNWKGVVAGAAVTVGVFALGGLYRGRRHVSFLDELPALCGRLLAAAAIVSIVGALRHDSVAAVGNLLRTMAVSALLVIVGRLVTRHIAVLARRRRWVEHSAIVLGGGPVAVELARLLRRYPEYGLRFVGF
ncbi:MAG TPA: sugar transferase, partial [Asanoa sp.]|nr:sugar transferase [Asanoa sp.]